MRKSSDGVEQQADNSKVMDRCKVSRIYCGGISLVSRHLRRLHLPDPTRGCDPLLRAFTLRRNLHRPRRRLQSSLGSITLIPRLGAPYITHRNLQRRYGRRSTTSFLLEGHRFPPVVQSPLDSAVHHRDVLNRPVVFECHLEGVHGDGTE